MAVERTLVLIKPDAMERGLADKIVKRYEAAGLKVVKKKVVKADKKLAEKHYPATDTQLTGMGSKTVKAMTEAGHPELVKKLFGTEGTKKVGMKLREYLVKFITSNPVTALLLEGEDAVQVVRRVSGYTDPSKAEKGTIRGDFGYDSINRANKEHRATKNLVHASGSREEAEREVKLWFG